MAIKADIQTEQLSQSAIIEFQQEIYALAKTGLTLLESIVEYCSKHDIEPDDIAQFISPKMRAEITAQAIEFRQLRSDAMPEAISFD